METKNYLISLFLLIFSISFGQVKEKEILSKNDLGMSNVIKLNDTKVIFNKTSIKLFLKKQYDFSKEVDFEVIENSKENNTDFQYKKLQQYYKGIKVEFAKVTATSKDGNLFSVNGEPVKIKNLNIKPQLSEKEALKKILNYINAEKYAWENISLENLRKNENKKENSTYYPKAELVILNYNSKPILVYKFDIYATSPISRANYYVNTKSGDIVLVDTILKHVEGTATTRYSGQRTIETTQVGNNFILHDQTRGNGIHTLNANHVFFDNNGNINLNNATDFNDNNNNWTNAEFNNNNKDNAALDAHWGAMNTFDYFSENHNRNSIDNQGFELLNYVHVGNNWENAAWDGERMLYGDGNTTFDALTSIDVIGHEIGHGLDQFTSDLVYQNESGAIDEGVADIWGAMVEFFAAPEKQTYLIGEEIRLNGGALRSMENPKTFNNPDTYQGDFWFTGSGDHGGVHTNSGIMGYWFFILAEGDTGTNDNGDFYDIGGLGKNIASNILYRAQIIFFSPNINYNDARTLTILAAESLYGTNSLEAVTVNNAWYAVGIGDLITAQLDGDNTACYSPLTTFTVTNFTASSVNWQVSSNLQITQSNNTSVTVKASSNATRGSGFVIANINGDAIRKDIWVGKPQTPTSIYGPIGVQWGAITRYTGSNVQGATSYQWWFPYPYEVNSTVITSPPMWRILSGENYRYARALVGPNSGLVQFMGENKCGIGGAKYIYVTIGGSNGGNAPGGQMPFTTLDGDNSDEGVSIFPNPADQEIIVAFEENNRNNILIFDINSKLVYKNTSQNQVEVINTSKFSNGIYFIRISGNKNTVKKIIIQH